MTSPIRPLPPDQLYSACDPETFSFETTAELPDTDELIGQERVVGALRFGIGIPGQGFNVFVLGPAAVDKNDVVRRFLKREGRPQSELADWCYAHNFQDPQRPRSLRLPARHGFDLRRDMMELVEDLKAAIPAAFEAEDYRERLAEIQEELQERQNRSLEELRKEVEKQGLGLLSTPQGFAIAPMRGERVLSNEDFERLSPEERERIQKLVADLMGKLRQRLERFPIWARETRKKAKDLEREIATNSIGPLLAELESKYKDVPEVVEYLHEVRDDLVENVHDFRRTEEGPEMLLGLPKASTGSAPFRRYEINVLVDNDDDQGPPIIHESNPTIGNLVGRIEHVSSFGTLVTDFSHIKPGALHRANGGYLVLDADRVLTQPFSWQILKQALFEGEIRIESLDRVFSLISTVTLEPEPIPLDAKVILLGNRFLYFLLATLDDDFADLFKVAADFEDWVDRSPGNVELYARLIATLGRRHELRPFHRTAVARVVDHLARLVSDGERLTAHQRAVADVLREADYWAQQRGAEAVQAEDIELAIRSQIRRIDRMQTGIQEEIRRGVLLIDTEGHAVGQVNGLSVIGLHDFAFGHPVRITATARLGKGDVVDIEREVELGGSIHSKGVLILSNFISHRYAPEVPLSLSASLVFEQSYGGVEGDSATIAETCALLSALSGLPIQQNLAVTGSMNQHGTVQAIGGVNEKIEGFFEVCRQRGLTGEQGVLIPSANVRHLMLQREVVEAVEAGKFNIYPISTVDEALNVLTGQPAGERQPDGTFPEGTVNRAVDDRLIEFAELQKEHRSNTGESSENPETAG